MKKILIYSFILFLVFIICTSMNYASTIYVYNAAGGNNDGSDWDNAYTSLQSALNTASSGDNIWIAKGTYKPSYDYGLTGGSRYYHFRMIEGVTIYGGFAGTESDINQRSNYGVGEANETVLSGDIGTEGNNSDNCYHVFYHPNGTGLSSAAGLDGLTITGGNANGSDPYHCGGGMYNYNCSPQFAYVAFINNSSSGNGGGIYNHGSSPTLSNVSINNNTSSYYGGGMYNSNTSSPNLNYVTISNNSAVNGGGLCNDGYNSLPVLNNVMISGNSADSQGGGIWNNGSYGPEDARVNMTNVTICSNSAAYGGGISNSYYSDMNLTNVTFSNNTATSNGGGVYCSSNSSDVTLYNCIIWGNNADSGDEVYNYQGHFYLTYCCYGSESGDIYNAQDFNADDYCITSDPCFVGAANNPTHPYSIGGISPCADTGNNGYNDEPFDVRGTGFPRKLNKTTGEAGTIDIGAYEYKFGTDPTLPVVLSIFTAQYFNNTPTIHWSTQSETDNMGWFVYRNIENDFSSSDVISDMIEGHGTTTQQQFYTYEDDIEDPEVGDTYYYWLESVDYSGIINHYDRVAILVIPDTHGSNNNLVPVPERFGLFQNEPNPVISTTRISFNLPETAKVELTIYNLKGQIVKKLYSGITSKHTVMWDGKDEQGNELENGVYLYTLIINEKTKIIKKLVLMK